MLVNGAECEPYLTSDYRRMMDEPEQVIEGLRVILKLFPGARGYICVEDNKMDCVERLKNLLLNDPRIGVKVMKTKYPQGAERMMIAAATKKADQFFPASGRCRLYRGQCGDGGGNLSGCHRGGTHAGEDGDRYRRRDFGAWKF